MAKFSNKTGAYGHQGEDDSDFVRVDADPWTAAGDRGSDSEGYKRGDTQAAGGQTTWDDEASNVAFAKPSQVRTDHGDGRDSVESIYSDVMRDQGWGEYGSGGSSVKEVGGGSGPPRFKPKSSKQARDDQSNDGI